MQTGIITSENLSQVLRSISQKRQTGILQITVPDNITQVMFISGKIVEAFTSIRDQWQDLKGRLRLAGFSGIPDDGQVDSYRDIFLMLQSRPIIEKPINEQDFRRLVRHRVLDVLYGITLDTQASFSFDIRSYEIDKDFSPSISVGQFLMDYVALEAEKERFRKIFPENCRIICLESIGMTLTEDESLLYSAISSGISKTELFNKSFLSEYSFQGALLSMYERALIEVESAGQSFEEPQELSDDILCLLEDHSERPLVEKEFRPLESDTKKSNLYKAEIEVNFDTEVLNNNSSQPANEDQPSNAAEIEQLEKDEEIPSKNLGKLAYFNIRLLNSNHVPNTIIFMFMVVSIMSILYLWTDIWAAF